MPVRNVVKRTKSTVRYLIPSFKNGRVIGCESGLEKDLALLAEFSSSVLSYEEQPETFRIITESSDFKATPDLKVILENGEIWFLEAKYQKKANELFERHQRIKAYLAGLGYRYAVLTEEHIRTNQIVLDSFLKLNAYRSARQVDISELPNYVPDGNFTLAELIEELGDDRLAMQLIAHQLIYHDYTKILTPKSELRAAEMEDFDFLTKFLM